MANSKSSASITTPTGATDTCAKFTIDTVTTPFILTGVCKIAGEYVFSAWIKSDVSASVQIDTSVIEIGTTWTKVSVDITRAATDNQDLAIYFKTATTYYMYHSQLEMGNKSTKWQPSPYDVQESVNAVKVSFDKLPDKILSTVEKTYNGKKIISTINQTVDAVSINADKINLNGAVTANSNFKILVDGSMEANNGKFAGDIIDKNGKKIISTEGVRAQLIFFAGNMTQCWGETPNSYIVGYYQSNGLYDYVKSDYFNIPYIISENFIIDKAYLDCYISCVHWTNDNIYGYPRNLKLYISPNYNYEFSFYGIGSTGRAVTRISLGKQITNCWEISDGASTTYDASLNASKHTVNVKTTDLTYYLNNNKNGLIYITHDGDDEMSTDYSNTSEGTKIVKKAEQYTGQISATLFVEGYFRQAS